MFTVCCWKWGDRFSPTYVHRLKAMVARHLGVPHRFVCVADSPEGLDGIELVPMPATYATTPRCRRRMWQFSQEFAETLGADRILCLDLDLVFVADVTQLLRRTEPVVSAWIEYGNTRVYSGSMILMNGGVLDGLWQEYQRDPEGYPVKAWPRGIGSDQAMLNFYLQQHPREARQVGRWTRRDGIITYFGEGYEQFEHLGVGPHRSALPPGTRVIVLGSDDKHVLEQNAFPWVREHWVA